MQCKHLTIRSKKYQKYIYCRKLKKEINYDYCKKCDDKDLKITNKPKYKTHNRTKATSISKDIKEIVWNRDNHKCILCGKYVPIECACCHFIPRSQGGLGIEENIFTACNDCHREQDSGLNTLLLESKVEKYLQEYYGAKWDKNNLIYNKI